MPKSYEIRKKNLRWPSKDYFVVYNEAADGFFDPSAFGRDLFTYFKNRADAEKVLNDLLENATDKDDRIFIHEFDLGCDEQNEDSLLESREQ